VCIHRFESALFYTRHVNCSSISFTTHLHEFRSAFTFGHRLQGCTVRASGGCYDDILRICYDQTEGVRGLISQLIRQLFNTASRLDLQTIQPLICFKRTTEFEVTSVQKASIWCNVKIIDLSS